MKTKEREIRFEDCHVGDVLRLKQDVLLWNFTLHLKKFL